jgi:hypothetical protein
VRERQHPKVYWVDCGVVRAAKRQLGAVGAEERGPLLEGWILTALRAHNADTNLRGHLLLGAGAGAADGSRFSAAPRNGLHRTGNQGSREVFDDTANDDSL